MTRDMDEGDKTKGVKTGSQHGHDHVPAEEVVVKEVIVEKNEGDPK